MSQLQPGMCVYNTQSLSQLQPGMFTQHTTTAYVQRLYVLMFIQSISTDHAH